MSAPYMPLYIPDLFADTMHLNCFERGAYIQLLCHMWRAGGKLPADDARLSRLLQLSVGEWVDIKGEILPFFIKRGNSISQKRLSKEMAKYDNKIVKAKTAAKSRWSEKDNKNNEKTISQALPMQCQQEQEQEQEQVIDKSIIEEKIKKEKPSSNISNQKSATALDENWQPSQSNLDYAKMKGVPNGRIEHEVEGFKDYWISKAKSNLSRNWSRNWQTWCRNAVDWHYSSNAKQTGFTSSKSNGTGTASRASAGLQMLSEMADNYSAGRA